MSSSSSSSHKGQIKAPLPYQMSWCARRQAVSSPCTVTTRSPSTPPSSTESSSVSTCRRGRAVWWDTGTHGQEKEEEVSVVDTGKQPDAGEAKGFVLGLLKEEERGEGRWVCWGGVGRGYHQSPHSRHHHTWMRAPDCRRMSLMVAPRFPISCPACFVCGVVCACVSVCHVVPRRQEDW